MVGLAQRALARIKSRQPVRDAVEKLRFEIYDARKAGVSWVALHAQLSSEGVYVGKGQSSLISAVKYWAEVDGVSLSRNNSSVPDLRTDSADVSYADNRFAPVWGRS